MALYGEVKEGAFELCPEGRNIPGVLLEIVYKKDNKQPWTWKFEIDSPRRSDGEPFLVFKNTYTSGPHVRQMAEIISGRYKPFTDEEWKAFDVQTLEGEPVMLDIVHNVTPDKTYVNIDKIRNPNDPFADD